MKKDLNDENLFELQKKAISDPSIPKIYANQTVNFNTPTDITVLLQNNNVPVAILNLSFEMAKTFALQLGELVTNLEERTKHDILTATDVIESFKQDNKDEKSDNK
jgi:hypothetical protein